MGNPKGMVRKPWTVPRRSGQVKCNAATLGDELDLRSYLRALRSFHRIRGTVNWGSSQLE